MAPETALAYEEKERTRMTKMLQVTTSRQSEVFGSRSEQARSNCTTHMLSAFADHGSGDMLDGNVAFWWTD